MKKDVSADGLRGLAALSVVMCHLLIAFFPGGFRYTYPGAAMAGANDGRVEGVLSLPVISALWNGGFAVCIFFVLSGYVLTKTFVESGDLNILRLRAARRYFRLSIPVFGSVMLSYALLSFSGEHWRIAGLDTQSWWLWHFWDFEHSMVDAIGNGIYGAIFGGRSFYTPPLWTMKVEFIGSIIVFSYRALCLRGVKALIMFCVVLTSLLFFSPGEWMFYLAFIIGSYIGEFRREPNRVIVFLSFLAALFFGGFDLSYWYEWSKIIPVSDADRKNIFYVLGGACMVYAVRGGIWKTIFESRFSQFLGRHSYSLYLVHFPILLTFSSWLYLELAIELGMNKTLAVFFVFTASIPVFLCAASIFGRIFDRSGILLSRRLFPDDREADSVDTRLRSAA